jgi:hypothetical protein
MNHLPESATPPARALYAALVEYRSLMNKTDTSSPAHTVASSCVKDFSLRDLFIAYDDLYQCIETNPPLHPFDVAPFVITAALFARRDEPAVLQAFADFTQERPETAEAVGFELFSNGDYLFSVSTLNTDLPGLLSPAIYSLTAEQTRPRSEYLLERVRSESPSLNPTARRIGLTLATKWAGTLDSLRETATALSQQECVGAA